MEKEYMREYCKDSPSMQYRVRVMPETKPSFKSFMLELPVLLIGFAYFIGLFIALPYLILSWVYGNFGLLAVIGVIWLFLSVVSWISD